MATTMVVESIMEKLEKMLVEEAALLAGVEDDVRYIVAELRSINSFLTTMSTKRNLDDQLQNWVQEVREVAYDAEDSIDEFECRLRSTPYDDHGVKGLLMHFCRCLRSLKARHGIASELKKLKVEIEEIRKRHNRYSHPNEAASSGTTTSTSLDMADRYPDPRTIGHFVEEAQLMGINQSRDKLIEWIMDKNCLELTTISLVGFGGLGKTTLAKTVYDDPIIVGGYFQYRIWVTVSQNYSIKELLKKIIRQISVKEKNIRKVLGSQDAGLNTEQLLDMMDEQQLVTIIKADLHRNRYLVVFDDVWRTEAWESLSIALPTGNEGSRVIVTTRIEEVAYTSCSRNRQFVFKVSPLSPELSWELFCRKVFESPHYSCPLELESVGREISQKCSGLPLAILTIGSLLASKPDKKLEEWKELCDHLHLEIQTNELLSKINQILILSYNDLPYHLKPCFLFLGTFPDYYEIHRKRLIRRWIAEGIVSGRDGFPAEKVAERCFNQLVNRNLVQPLQFDDSGKVKSCRVHEMMLDVIISISRKENFVVLLNEQLKIPPQHQKIRRLSCHGRSNGLAPHTNLCHLRSFTVFGEAVALKYYRKQRLLRAIDLEGCWNLFHPGLETFSKLFLLKYLSLRNTGLSELPDSIGDLQNLEFLDIRGTYIHKLPNAIVKLQNLVYLLAGGLDKRSTFMGFKNLTNLMEFTILKVPKGIRKLKRLESFGMAFADNVQLLQELGELVNLQMLGICFGEYDLEHRMLEEINALLSKLDGSLKSLTILHLPHGNLQKALDEIALPPLLLVHGNLQEAHDEILQKAKALDEILQKALNEIALPPLLLCKIQIHGKLNKLPYWFASLKHVVKITLSNTLLQLQDLQVLRNLPKLVKLILGFKSFCNNAENLVFEQGGFLELKFLEIQSHCVSFNVGAVQSLEILKMSGSFSGYSIDGIEHLRLLKEVHIQTWEMDIHKMVKNIAAKHSNRPKCYCSTKITT